MIYLFLLNFHRKASAWCQEHFKLPSILKSHPFQKFHLLFSLLQHAFSRAYINFKRFEDLALFRNAFDGFIFNAGKGKLFPLWRQLCFLVSLLERTLVITIISGFWDAYLHSICSIVCAIGAKWQEMKDIKCMAIIFLA